CRGPASPPERLRLGREKPGRPLRPPCRHRTSRCVRLPSLARNPEVGDRGSPAGSASSWSSRKASSSTYPALDRVGGSAGSGESRILGREHSQQRPRIRRLVGSWSCWNDQARSSANPSLDEVDGSPGSEESGILGQGHSQQRPRVRRVVSPWSCSNDEARSSTNPSRDQVHGSPDRDESRISGKDHWRQRPPSRRLVGSSSNCGTKRGARFVLSLGTTVSLLSSGLST